MRAFIQCNKNYIPYNKNAYTALEGFNQMGVETILFHTKDELSNSNPEDIIVGGVGRVKERLEQLGIAVNDIDYPAELENYTVCSAVKNYATAPAAYAMDFGVTDSGATILVEVNDGYSLGNYGLDSLLYAKLLSARWAELTNTIDECNF